MRIHVCTCHIHVFCVHAYISAHIEEPTFIGLPKGLSIKYVTLFFANFYPFPQSHFVTHPGTPQKVPHTYRTPPRFLVGLVQKILTKFPCTNSLLIVLGGFYPGVLS